MEAVIQKRKKPVTAKTVASKSAFYLLLVVLCVLFLFPIFWMAMNSMKPHAQIYADMNTFKTFLPSFHASEWFASYGELFTMFKYFGRSILNSLIYCAVTIAGVLVVNSLAAYALSRFKFPGHKVLVTIIVLLLMIPVETSIVPQVIILRSLGLLKGNMRILGYLIPAIVSPMYIFQFRSFFLGIPKELEEAAYIDGCGRFKTFFRVIVPCSMPVFATVAIFTFMGQWNEYVFANYMFAAKESFKPLQVFLQLVNTHNPQDLSCTLAALTFGTVPIAIVYIFFQRWIIEGVAFSGLK